MQAILLALVDLIKPYITPVWAFIMGFTTKGAQDNARQSNSRIESLAARVAAQNEVAAMSPNAIHDELLRDWSRDDPRQAVRGNGKSLNIK